MQWTNTQFLHFVVLGEFSIFLWDRFMMYCEMIVLKMYQLLQNRCLMIQSLSWATYRQMYHIVSWVTPSFPPTPPVLLSTKNYISSFHCSSECFVQVYIYIYSEDYHICCIFFAVVDLIASLCACLLQMSFLWGLLWYSLLCESPVHTETMVLLVSYSSGCVYCFLLQGEHLLIQRLPLSSVCLFVRLCDQCWADSMRVPGLDFYDIMIIFQRRNTDLMKSLLSFLFRS